MASCFSVAAAMAAASLRATTTPSPSPKIASPGVGGDEHGVSFDVCGSSRRGLGGRGALPRFGPRRGRSQSGRAGRDGHVSSCEPMVLAATPWVAYCLRLVPVVTQPVVIAVEDKQRVAVQRPIKMCLRGIRVVA